MTLRGRAGDRQLPATYVRDHLELSYAITVYGAQGETVDQAHLLVGESTGAAAAYVGMTRGRKSNTAHLVAESVDEARAQWIEVFARDRADLGPAHAARAAADDIDRYGPSPRRTRASRLPRTGEATTADKQASRRRREPLPAPRRAPDRGPSIGM